jgi:hypothetical protein
MSFAFVLVLSGIKIVDVPGASTIIVVALGLVLLALLVWGSLRLRLRLAPAPD